MPSGVFLMAPAIGIEGYGDKNPEPRTQHLSIVMGWQDEIIPVQNVIAFAQSQRAELHLLNADHRLDGVLSDIGLLFEQFLSKVMA
jgi:hypothetical protein